MDVYEILVSLFDKPEVPKFYRELKNYYAENHMTHEAAALDHLIEKKFEKKDVEQTDNTDIGQK
jgi:RAB protein geranylgeranyltransferase component A